MTGGSQIPKGLRDSIDEAIESTEVVIAITQFRGASLISPESLRGEEC